MQYEWRWSWKENIEKQEKWGKLECITNPYRVFFDENRHTWQPGAPILQPQECFELCTRPYYRDDTPHGEVQSFHWEDQDSCDDASTFPFLLWVPAELSTRFQCSRAVFYQRGTKYDQIIINESSRRKDELHGSNPRARTHHLIHVATPPNITTPQPLDLQLELPLPSATTKHRHCKRL